MKSPKILESINFDDLQWKKMVFNQRKSSSVLVTLPLMKFKPCFEKKKKHVHCFTKHCNHIISYRFCPLWTSDYTNQSLNLTPPIVQFCMNIKRLITGYHKKVLDQIKNFSCWKRICKKQYYVNSINEQQIIFHVTKASWYFAFWLTGPFC